MGLLLGLAIGALAVGAFKHSEAVATNQAANSKVRQANKIYESAKERYNKAKDNCDKTLYVFGTEKQNVLDTSIASFLTCYDKFKHIELHVSPAMQELARFDIGNKGALQLAELSNIYKNALPSAATGAVVSLAAGGLSALTGGAAAGAAIGGAAAGTLGSIVSPLAMIAGPIALFTGFSAAREADANLSEARAMLAEAEAQAAKMDAAITIYNAVAKRSEMLNKLLKDLNSLFAYCTNTLRQTMPYIEQRWKYNKDKQSSLTESEYALLAVTRSLAGAVKAIIDTPILSSDGTVSKQSAEIEKQTEIAVPKFNDCVIDVKYGIATDTINELYDRQSQFLESRQLPSRFGRIYGQLRNIIPSLKEADSEICINDYVAYGLSTGKLKQVCRNDLERLSQKQVDGLRQHRDEFIASGEQSMSTVLNFETALTDLESRMSKLTHDYSVPINPKKLKERDIKRIKATCTMADAIYKINNAEVVKKDGTVDLNAVNNANATAKKAYNSIGSANKAGGKIFLFFVICCIIAAIIYFVK